MLDPEAATLRHALRTAHREGVGRAYPKILRERVVAYVRKAAASGRPRADVADALCLSLATLARWAQLAVPVTPATPSVPVMTGKPMPAMLVFSTPIMAPIVSGSSSAKAR